MKYWLKYIQGYKIPALLGPVFKLIEAVLELYVPLVVAALINDGIVEKGLPLWQYGGQLMGLAVAGVIFSVIAQYFSAVAATGIVGRISEDTFQHVQSLGEQTTLSPSALVARLTSDTLQIQTGLNLFFRLLLRSPFVVFGALWMIVRLNHKLAFFVAMMIVILFIILAVMLFILRRPEHQLRLLTERLMAQVGEQLKGIQVVRSFNRVISAKNDFQQTNGTLYDWQRRLNLLSVLSNPLTFVVVNVTVVWILVQGGHQVTERVLQTGTLVAIVNYLMQMLIEMVKLMVVLVNMNRALISAKRIQQLLIQPSENLSATLNNTVQQDDNVYELKNVSYYYPEAPIPALSQLNFTIQKGELVGIIGGTGAGKTTLALILSQLMTQTEGEVNIPYQLTIEQLRQDVSLATQKSSLLSGTIRSNLLLANANATDEQLWEVLRWAQAEKFVQNKEKGLDSEIETFGRNLSGGQRQRIHLARALLKESSTLILDDVTSALDALTESRVLSAIWKLKGKKTVIMMSQRPSILQQVDKIIVLDQGKQVAVGTPSQLLKTCEVYAEMCKLEAEGVNDDE